MVPLFQGTDGLFFFFFQILTERTATICATTLRCNMCDGSDTFVFFYCCWFFFQNKKKGTHTDKKNWPIKIPHMFLVLEMFLFNCPWGTESEIM